MRHLGLLLALAALLPAGCARVEHTSTVHGDGVIPPQLLGEWRGSWTSLGSAGGGQVTVKLQHFQLRPLVALQLDNPCLQPAEYELRLEGRTFVLLADGEPLFVAQLRDDSRTFVGTYACHADHGTWEASWVRELPPVGDVTGDWLGTYQSSSPQSTGAFTLELEQVYDHGRLLVAGRLEFPGEQLPPVECSGDVLWAEGEFQLQLASEPGTPAYLVLLGHGDGEHLTVEGGNLLILNGSPLPFQSATWSAAWLGR